MFKTDGMLKTLLGSTMVMLSSIAPLNASVLRNFAPQMEKTEGELIAAGVKAVAGCNGDIKNKTFNCVATSNGAEVGWAAGNFKVLAPNMTFIESITTDPNARRNGVATSLLASVESLAKTAGTNQVCASVAKTEEAQAFLRVLTN
jgi:hypothetical protein